MSRNWKKTIGSKAFRADARAAESTDELADTYGVSASTIRRQWRRHGKGQLADVIGTASGRVTARDFDNVEFKPAPMNVPKNLGAETFVVDVARHERWLIPGDIHFGVQDDVAIDLMRRCAEDWGITRVVNQGDTFDTYGVSRYDKQAARIRGAVFTLEDEARLAAPWLRWCAQTEQESIIIMGNHEARIDQVVDRNPGLWNSVSFRDVFRIPNRVRIVEHQGRVRAGSLVVEHGDAFARNGGSNAAQVCLSCQPDQTTVFGHTHRILAARRTTYDRHGELRTRGAFSIGHMSIPESHRTYAGTRSNWQQGFMLIEFWRSVGGDLRYTPYQVELHGHEFCFNGKVYRPRRKSQRG